MKKIFQLPKFLRNLVMCGIVGIVSSDDVNQQIYDSLLLLQHRGQDSTGIATMENTIFHIHKAKGHVNKIYVKMTIECVYKRKIN